MLTAIHATRSTRLLNGAPFFTVPGLMTTGGGRAERRRKCTAQAPGRLEV
jgi:hypothetical protein